MLRVSRSCGLSESNESVLDSAQMPILLSRTVSKSVVDRKYSRSGANWPPGGTNAGCTVNDGSPSIGPALMLTSGGSGADASAALAASPRLEIAWIWAPLKGRLKIENRLALM